MRDVPSPGPTDGAVCQDLQRPARVLRLTVEYHGAGFAGWQVQTDARTVQGEVERALALLLREPVRLQGASRTDAGVHAQGQVASVVTRSSLTCGQIHSRLGSLLPDDVVVLSVEDAPPSFNARHSSRGKHYRYRVLERLTPSPLEAATAWHVPHPLDLAAMQRAADVLVGRRDFAALVCRSSEPARPDQDAVRTLHLVRVERTPLAGADRGAIVTIDVAGDYFLYKMVRTIAGTLVHVGRGLLAPGSIAALLASGDRRKAGPTAPAQGLVLVRVLYDDAPALQTEGAPQEGVSSEGEHHGSAHERPRLDPAVRGGEGAAPRALLRAAP